jgi:ammonia channel protein AmtB
VHAREFEPRPHRAFRFAIAGSYEHFLLLGVDYWKCSPHAPYIPAACFALFQMMFATITPLLMTG